MLWQWTLFLIVAVYMPAASLAPQSWSNSGLVSTLLPMALPIFLAARWNNTVRYYYRFTLYCTTLGLTSMWAVALSVAMSLVGASSSIQHYVARSFYYFASPILGWTLNVEGEQYLKTDSPVVFIGNHQSMIDILYLGRIFPKRTSVMAKRELKWTPFLGQFMWLSNAVFVDRKNRQDAVKTFAKAADDMKRKGMSIFIFAEGTRSNTAEPTMLPFKRGAFHLAVSGQFPIVPIVMENYNSLYSGKQKRFEAGKLTVRALPPVSTVGKTGSKEDIDGLVATCRERMVAALEDLHARKRTEATQKIT